MTLHWLHYETEPLHWLGLVRSIVEPRLPKPIQLDIRCHRPASPLQTPSEPQSHIISWTYSPNAPTLNWHGLWQLRQDFPNTLRIVLGSPTQPAEQIPLLEAGAHLLIPDALSLCHWLPKLLATEYPHRST